MNIHVACIMSAKSSSYWWVQLKQTFISFKVEFAIYVNIMVFKW